MKTNLITFGLIISAGLCISAVVYTTYQRDLAYQKLEIERLRISEERRAREEELAEKHRAREFEEQETATMALVLVDCLREAGAKYYASWDSSCEGLGLGPGCGLPRYTAERWDEWLSSEKAHCVELWKGSGEE